jgi:hypothetical protein
MSFSVYDCVMESFDDLENLEDGMVDASSHVSDHQVSTQLGDNSPDFSIAPFPNISFEDVSSSSRGLNIEETSHPSSGLNINEEVGVQASRSVFMDSSPDSRVQHRLDFSGLTSDSEGAAGMPVDDDNSGYYGLDMDSDAEEYNHVGRDEEDEDDELPSFDQVEREDLFHCEVNHFPSPILSGNQGTLLHHVNCSFDVDSIYFVGDSPSQVLEFMGGDGVCTFQSAVSRVFNTQSSRIAVDYHGREDLLPNVRGRKLKGLKVICLHHFPNFEFLKVCTGNIEFRLNLHILQPGVLTGNGYMTHEMLLTLICALNIAIDGVFPFDPIGEDEEYAMSMEAKYQHDWSSLPFFELQDGSVNNKKMIHNVQKKLSLESSIPFFFRFEQALKVMSTTPELIDPHRQEGNADY